MKPKLLELGLGVLRASGLPEAYWRLQTDTYLGNAHSLKQAVAFALNFELAKANNMGLTFSGPPQTFKTFLAAHVGRILLSMGYSVGYYSLETLSTAYMAGFNHEINFVEAVKEPELLIVDCVVAPHGKAHRTAFERAISARVDSNRPVVVCTEYANFGDFEEPYSASVYLHLETNTILSRTSVVDPFTQANRVAARKLKLET